MLGCSAVVYSSKYQNNGTTLKEPRRELPFVEKKHGYPIPCNAPTFFPTVPRTSDAALHWTMFRKSPKKSPARDYEVLNEKYIQQTNDYELLRAELNSLKSKYATATSELEDAKEQSKKKIKLAEKRESDMRRKYKDEIEAMQATALRRENEMKRLREDLQRYEKAKSKYPLDSHFSHIFGIQSVRIFIANPNLYF